MLPATIPSTLPELVAEALKLLEAKRDVLSTEQAAAVESLSYALAEGSPAESVAESLLNLAEAPEVKALEELLALIRKLLKMMNRHMNAPEPEDKHEMEAAVQTAVESDPGALLVNISQIVEIAEAIAPQGSTKNAWRVRIIQEGFNTSKSRYYESSALDSMLPLLEKLPCFLNHPRKSDESERPERSVEDIVGWYTAPKRVGKAVEATLHLLGEGSKHAWLPKMLSEAAASGNLGIAGLSIYGKGAGEIAKGAEGQSYLKVKLIAALQSADIVTRPGAGGGFLSLSEAAAQEAAADKLLIEAAISQTTTKEDTTTVTETTDPAVVDAKIAEVDARLKAIAEAEERIKLAECRLSLSTRLTESKLPEVQKARVRKAFEGKVFDIAELDARLAEEAAVREEILKTVSPSDHSWNVRVTTDEKDKLGKALEGLLWGQSVDGVQPFRNLREAFCKMTGADPNDPYLPNRILSESTGYSSVDPKAIQLRESNTVLSTTWSVILGEYIHRVMLRWMAKDTRYDDWKKIVSSIVSLTDFKAQRRSTIGGFNMPPEVEEGGTYQEDATPSEYAVSYTPTKYGRLSVITLEAVANDDLGAIREIPKNMALGHKVRLYRAVFGQFLLNTRTGPSLDYDSTVLFHSNHSNINTNALSSAYLTTGRNAMVTQYYPGTTEVHLLNEPKYFLVCSTLRPLAFQLVTSAVQILGSSYNATDPNIHQGAYEVIEVPYWDATSTTCWFLVADPTFTPTIEVGLWQGKDEPEIFTQDDPKTGSMFTADKLTYKSRSIFGVEVLHHAGLYRGNA